MVQTLKGRRRNLAHMKSVGPGSVTTNITQRTHAWNHSVEEGESRPEARCIKSLWLYKKRSRPSTIRIGIGADVDRSGETSVRCHRPEEDGVEQDDSRSNKCRRRRRWVHDKCGGSVTPTKKLQSASRSEKNEEWNDMKDSSETKIGGVRMLTSAEHAERRGPR